MIADACCWLCRSATGICLTRNRCDHHIKAARVMREEDSRSQLTYRDPTGEKAAGRVDRARSPRRR